MNQLNTTVPEMDIYSRQKINKDRVELNNTTNQLDKVDIYKLLHPATPKTHLSQTHMERSPRQTTHSGYKTQQT